MVCRGPAWAGAVEGVTPVDPGVRVGGVGRLVRLAVGVWGALPEMVYSEAAQQQHRSAGSQLEGCLMELIVNGCEGHV